MAADHPVAGFGRTNNIIPLGLCKAVQGEIESKELCVPCSVFTRILNATYNPLIKTSILAFCSPLCRVVPTENASLRHPVG